MPRCIAPRLVEAHVLTIAARAGDRHKGSNAAASIILANGEILLPTKPEGLALRLKNQKVLRQPSVRRSCASPMPPLTTRVGRTAISILRIAFSSRPMGIAMDRTTTRRQQICAGPQALAA
jgi:hypothetical protein